MTICLLQSLCYFFHFIHYQFISMPVNEHKSAISAMDEDLSEKRVLDAKLEEYMTEKAFS